MKIAIVSTSFPDPEHNYIWTWIEELSKYGFLIDVFAEKINFNTKKSRYYNNSTIWSRIHCFANPIHPFEMSARCVLDSIRSVGYPKRILDMISYLLKQESKKCTVLRKSLEYLPWINKQYDLVHINYPRIAVRRMELGELIRSKTLVSFRGQDLAHSPGMFQPVFERADHLHFISNYLYQQAQDQGYAKENYSIIPPMVDTSFFFPCSKTGKKDILSKNQHFIIFTSAKLKWLKGFEFALKAIEILLNRGWNIDYYIAGDGDYREQVSYTIRDLNLEDRVHLLGWLDIDQSRDWMQKSDLYLLCSVQEGFNNSVLQAQACGLPCVVTDANGLPESIEDGVTGLLAGRRDPYDIADKIETLLKNPELLAHMRQQGRIRVVDRFDKTIITSKFVDLYTNIVNTNE